MFFCSSCCPRVPLALKIDDLNRSVSSGYENIYKAITDLSTKIDNLNSSESELQKSIAETATALSTVHSSAPNNADIAPSSPASVHIVDALDEYMDRERRRHNLVIYGMPESSNSTSAELGTDDQSRFSGLVRSQFNIENINISKVIRIGRSTNNKPRPLLVTLLDDSSRRYILQNAKSLRNNSTYNNVYISPDLTPKEREINRQLHTELKRRKQAGETNLMIKRGKIIIKQPNPQLNPSNNNSAMELGDRPAPASN